MFCVLSNPHKMITFLAWTVSNQYYQTKKVKGKTERKHVRKIRACLHYFIINLLIIINKRRREIRAKAKVHCTLSRVDPLIQ